MPWIITAIGLVVLAFVAYATWLYLQKRTTEEAEEKALQAENEMLKDLGLLKFQDLSLFQRLAIIKVIENDLLLRRMEVRPEAFGELQPVLQRARSEAAKKERTT